jgi:hypothetical protein
MSELFSGACRERKREKLLIPFDQPKTMIDGFKWDAAIYSTVHIH